MGSVPFILRRPQPIAAICEVSFRPEADINVSLGLYCRKTTPMQRNDKRWWLLDQFIGTEQECLRHVHPKIASQCKVDHQIVLGNLLDWQVAGLCTFEEPVDVTGDKTHYALPICPIGHEHTFLMIVPIREYGGNASSAYSPSNVPSVAEQEKITLDD